MTVARGVALLNGLLITAGIVLTNVLAGAAALLDLANLVVIAVGATMAGALVLAARPGHRVGRLFLVNGLLGAVGVSTGALSYSGDAGQRLHLAVIWPTYAMIVVILLVLPDGRPVTPRWRGWIVVAWCGVVLPTAAGLLLALAAPEMLRDPEGPAPWRGTIVALAALGFGATALALVAGLAALLVRWRRAPRGRGAAARLLLLLGLAPLLGFLLDAASVPGAYLLGAVSFPLVMLTAALRHRLLDLDLVLNRTLIWLGATVLLLAGFLGIVWLSSWGLVGAPWEVVAPVAVAALVTALLVAPVHAWLRRRLYRGLYGRRNEPDAAFATLDERVDAADSNGVLDAAAAAIAESLALPYVVVEVTDRGKVRRAAVGRPAGEPVRLPLTHRGREVGAVEVTARSRQERLTDRERSTVVVLARAAVTTARSVALADSLQTAREGLVHAREEERLRLRHDLHDGVSPTLAGVRLLARSLQRDPDPATAATLLDAAGTAAEEVTRVVDGLRPPALDIGLVGALEQLADHMAGGPLIRIDGTDCPPLTPAVEVALYRIASEALSNVIRHARATSCTVRLERHDDHVVLTVTDDGSGLQRPPGRVGVGLVSMRARAEELGGTCEVDAPPIGGTRIRVRVPHAHPAVPTPREGRDGSAVTSGG